MKTEKLRGEEWVQGLLGTFLKLTRNVQKEVLSVRTRVRIRMCVCMCVRESVRVSVFVCDTGRRRLHRGSLRVEDHK